MNNYWDKWRKPGAPAGLMPNPNAPTAPTDNDPVAQAVLEALNREDAPFKSPYGPGFTAQQMPGPNNMLGDAQQTYGPVATGDHSTFQPTFAQDNVVRRFTPINPNAPALGSSMGKAGGSFLDAITGIAQSIVGAAGGNSGGDPNDILNQLRQQYGQYQYGGPSAETMAAREFDPQFAALSAAEAGTQKRYGINSQQMKGLYDAYANSVLDGRSQDAANYAAGTKSINDTYQGAKDNVTQNMNSATDEMSKQLALLGQEQAAPTVFNKKQELLNQQLGQLSNAQGTSAALNTQLGNNAYAYDTANHGTAQQAGINAQFDLASQLESAMAGYGQQNMMLQGQKGQALNKYGMDIQSLINQGNSSIGSQVNDAFNTIMQAQSKEDDRSINRARLDLDQQRFLADQSKSTQNPNSMNPYDALTQRAYGSIQDPQQASNAVETLYQTGMLDPNAQNIKVLMDLLEQNNPGWLSDPNNKALAYDYFSKVLAGKSRP